MENSGIYKIVNRDNGSFYLGSSTNLKHRWISHRSYLRRNKHSNPYLQNAWNAYGEDAFEFIIIENVEKEMLLKKEQEYLNKCFMLGRAKFYNLCETANGSAANKGRKFTKEHRERISKALRGKVSKFGEKNPFFGKQHKKETIEKMRESMPHTKLDRAKVEKIKALHKEGKTQAFLAKEFFVSPTTIHRILNNKRWKE